MSTYATGAGNETVVFKTPHWQTRHHQTVHFHWQCTTCTTAVGSTLVITVCSAELNLGNWCSVCQRFADNTLCTRQKHTSDPVSHTHTHMQFTENARFVTQMMHYVQFNIQICCPEFKYQHMAVLCHLLTYIYNGLLIVSYVINMAHFSFAGVQT